MAARIKIPRPLKRRLRDVAKNHEFESIDALALHFVDRGLLRYGELTGDLDDRIEAAVDQQGYSSRVELIEHLLLRGLRAYEDAPDDPEALRERLKGLGYIE